MVVSHRTRTVRLWYLDGLAVREDRIEVPWSTSDDFNSCYFFCFTKSGSVLVNNMLKEMCAASGITCFALSDMLFARGIAANSYVADYASLFSEKGYCFYGFRSVPESMRGTLEALPGRKALLVRDPRDMLVSLYFSMQLSHSSPPQRTVQFDSDLRMSQRMIGMDIDEFCLLASSIYLKQLSEMFELVDIGAKMIKYEEFIYDKAIACRNLRDHFDILVSDAEVARIAARYDNIPARDQPDNHVRQVHPGDHRRKLKASTIDALNAALHRFLDIFGYA